jgi:hypothetical protein
MTSSKPLVFVLLAILAFTVHGCGEDGGGVDGYVVTSGPGATDSFGVPTGPRESLPPDPEIAALLLQDTVVVASAPVVNGGFSFRHVAPGRYRVCAALRGTLSDTVGGVEVGNGRMTLDRPLSMPDTGITVGGSHASGGQCRLMFTCGQARTVSIEVFDRHGKLVRHLLSRSMPSGLFVVQWDLNTDTAAPAPSGWYLVVLHKGPLALATPVAGSPAGRYDTVPPPPTNDPLLWGRAHVLIP